MKFGSNTTGGRSGRRYSGWALALGVAWALAVLAALGGCSGGGGGSDGATTAPSTSLSFVQVHVSDSYGAAVAGAAVTPNVSGAVSGITDGSGMAVAAFPAGGGTPDITVSRDTFVDQTVNVANPAVTVEVTLQRQTAPAGGAMATRSGALPTVGGNGQTLTFEVELVVVDGQSQAVPGLGSADFVLRDCTPDAATAGTDCLRGGTADQAYTSPGAAASVELVPGATAQPYAAVLMMDQSGSIATSDPVDARLYSAKAMLASLGASDRVELAAFASGDARIPTTPLTLYPPFVDATTASTYYPTLDALAPLVGGETPLYTAVDTVRSQLAADATLPAGLGRSLVVFTDGADTTCGNADACDAQRAQTIAGASADGVRIFTIGLSNNIDVAALGELAVRTGGAMLYAENAQQLIPLYGSVGRLASLALDTYRLRWTVDAGQPGVFASGQTLHGRVQVHAAGQTFDVPIIVAVP